MSAAAKKRLRDICLALPEAAEKLTWDEPNWRVRDRIFAMCHVTDGRLALWCKAPPGTQELLVAADPARFFRPPYVGPKGWIGVRLEGRPDWGEIVFLIRRSYRMTAPKRLAATLPEPPEA